jgi:formylglycine-generating enzyme required for sulfatase activity
LAVGGVSRPNKAETAVWTDLFSRWYAEAPQGGTHSAAGWALRQWGLPLPAVAETERPVDERDWWQASNNLTLVRIPTGVFQVKKDLINVEEEFWISDRETTVQLFWQFVNDEDYQGPRPQWDGPTDFGGLSKDDQLDHPVQNVSWYDAVMFCNWMSDQYDQLDRCYEIEVDEAQPGHYSVTLIPGARGFRLPTDAQWEHACRAMSTSTYSFGEDQANLPDYAVFADNSNSQTARVGGLRCNAWGLFDMHGNVYEWCWEGFDATDVTRRVFRGGCWYFDAEDCESSFRLWIDASKRALTQGFRLALDSPGLDAGAPPARGADRRGR